MRDPRALALAALLLASAPASAAAASGPADLLDGATGPVEGESAFGSARRRLALHRRRSVREDEGEAFQRRELGDGSKAAKKDAADESDVDRDDSDEDGEECTCEEEEEDAHAKRFRQQLHKMKMAKQQKKHRSRRLENEGEMEERVEIDALDAQVFEMMEAEELDADEEDERRLKRKKEQSSKKKQHHKRKKQHHKKKKGKEESGSSKGSKQGQLGSKSRGTTKQPSNSPSGSPASAVPTASMSMGQTTAPTNGKGGKGSKSNSGKAGKGPSSSGKSGKGSTKTDKGGSSKSRKTKVGKSKSGKGCVCVPSRSPTQTEFPTPGRTGSPTVDPTPEPTKAPATDPPTPPPVDPPTTPNPTTPNPTTPDPATPNPTTPPPVDPPTPPPVNPSTEEPTGAPTSRPTPSPTEEPTKAPTNEPTTPNPSTPNPTPPPVDPSTEEPTRSPTLRPTPSPTEEPTKAPTNEPTTPAPTTSPTKAPVDGPSGTKVANVIIALDPAPALGCISTQTDGFLYDQTIAEYICPYLPPDLPQDGAPEIVVTSDPSVVTALRVYAANAGPTDGGQDPTSYKLEGRTESGEDWVLIAEGDFDAAWVDAIPARNPAGAPINSSYEEADGSLSHTEVQFENTDLFFAYRITFPTTRNDIPIVRMGEVELVGIINDSYVASVSEGLDPVPASGCEAQGTAEDGPNLDDGIISNYYCLAEDGSELPQLVVRAALSVVTEIRVYANTNAPNADPLDFTLEGLQDEASDTWASIADGDFDDAWIASPFPDRNENGTLIASSYLSGDNSLQYGFASFPNDVAYSTYRLTFPTIRFRTGPPQPYFLRVGELELVGRKTGPG